MDDSKALSMNTVTEWVAIAATLTLRAAQIAMMLTIPWVLLR